MRIIKEQKRNKNLYKKHKHVILSSSCLASKQIFFRLLINSCVLKAVNLLDNLDASTVIITIMVFHANVSWCHHWNRGPLRSREPLLSSRFHEPNWTKHMDTPFFLSASLSSTAPFVWYHQIFYQDNLWVNFYNLFFCSSPSFQWLQSLCTWFPGDISCCLCRPQHTATHSLSVRFSQNGRMPSICCL